MSRQKATFAAEMSRQKALAAKAERNCDLIKSGKIRNNIGWRQISDGTTNKDPQAGSESLRELASTTKPSAFRCENVHVVGHTYLNESRLDVRPKIETQLHPRTQLHCHPKVLYPVKAGARATRMILVKNMQAQRARNLFLHHEKGNSFFVFDSRSICNCNQQTLHSR